MNATDEDQINRWANRALENLLGGWHALAEHQIRLIIDATGGLDSIAREAARLAPEQPSDVAEDGES